MDYDRLGVGHWHAGNFALVLSQNRGGNVLEDDIVLGVTLAELSRDFLVKIVVLVFRFPIAERQAQALQQRAVNVATVSGWWQIEMLGDEL